MTPVQNIVIIEDNETFSLLVTHYLKTNLGHTKVFVENSGNKAIERIEVLKPSLVILDYYLENQLSAKDVMFAINKMKHRPKVILFSSITDVAERDAVLAMGVDSFLPKTNESLYDLLITIERLLQESATSQVRRTGLTSSKTMLIGIVVFLVLLMFIVFGLLG